MGKNLFQKMFGNENSIRERLCRIIICMGIVAMFFAMIANLALQESVEVMIPLCGGMVVLWITLWLSYHHRKTEFAAMFLVILVDMVMFPVIFMTSGGIYSGSTVWFVLGIIFIFLLFKGKRMILFLVLTLLEYMVVYYVGYKHPEWIIPMASTADVYFDSASAVVLVSVVIGILIKFQFSVYESEQKLAEQRRKEIEQISQSKSSFFANMSHEIRTPINTIIGLNEMTLREDISEEIEENSVNIQNASKMLLSLINDILDISKIESGKMEIVPTQYETGAMFSELVNIIWIRAHEKKLEFKLDIAANLPSMLYGDEVRIKQILINILTNAIKYTQTGSITLAARCEQKESNLVQLKIAVTDTGIGIRKESMEELFSSFRRVDQEKNNKIEGTGLGLSISKQLIELMGGKIEVDSIYTKGSTFTITLDQQVVDEKPIGALDFIVRKKIYNREKYKQRFEAPDVKVLVVDDNEMNRMVVVKLLRATKVQVDTAKSGKECLEKTKTRAYHIIFMDHKMPDMDGVETLELLRKQDNGLCQKVPVVALTANVMSGAERIYQGYGFQGYLSKPINGTLLEAALLRYLPEDLIEYSMDLEERENTAGSIHMINEKQKKPICITTDCVCDIPKAWVEKYKIPMMSYYVVTDQGKFCDLKEINSDNLLFYLEDKEHHAHSEPASVEEYEKFFADALEEAEQVIHISMASNSSQGWQMAQSAAKGFDHVIVVDSGHLSSGMGLMVLYAAKMAQEKKTVEEILATLKELKSHVSTSFIVPTIQTLHRNGHVGKGISALCEAMEIEPILYLTQSKIKLLGVEVGSYEHAAHRYIRRQLRRSKKIDKRLLFITHAGCTMKQQQEIAAEVKKYVEFERVVFQKASATISSNCGLGAFGLLFLKIGSGRKP